MNIKTTQTQEETRKPFVLHYTTKEEAEEQKVELQHLRSHLLREGYFLVILHGPNVKAQF